MRRILIAILRIVAVLLALVVVVWFVRNLPDIVRQVRTASPAPVVAQAQEGIKDWSDDLSAALTQPIGNPTPMARIGFDPGQNAQQQQLTPDSTEEIVPTVTLEADTTSNQTDRAATVASQATDANVQASSLVASGVLTSEIVSTQQLGGWTIQWTEVAFRDRGDGTSFYDFVQATWPEWIDLDPARWPTPPNVPNPMEAAFRVQNVNEVPDGIEIPDGLQNFCQVVRGQPCSTPVAARHYMLYTGDGNCAELAWQSKEGVGNALSIWNVGNETALFTCVFHQGWRNTGRYFNGNALNIGITALHAHTANMMHNQVSPLNPRGAPNAGANCSVPTACETVHHSVRVTSGAALMAIMEAETTR